MMLVLHIRNCNVSDAVFLGFVVFGAVYLYACMFMFICPCCSDLMWTPVRSAAKAVKAYGDLNQEIKFILIEFYTLCADMNLVICAKHKQDLNLGKPLLCIMKISSRLKIPPKYAILL